MCEIKTWLGEWKIVKYRFCWGVGYLIAGMFLIIVFKVKYHEIDLLWSLGWSSVGIGTWLINSRERNKDNARYNHWLHFVLYFGFALVVSTLAAFALGRCENGNLNLPLSA